MITQLEEAPLAGEDESSPSQEPQDGIKDLAHVFKMLSDETRLQILLHLAEHDELHVRALCEILRQSQPAVSHHLSLLRDCKLIECRRQGKHNFYRVRSERFRPLFSAFFSKVPYSRPVNRLETLVSGSFTE